MLGIILHGVKGYALANSSQILQPLYASNESCRLYFTQATHGGLQGNGNEHSYGCHMCRVLADIPAAVARLRACLEADRQWQSEWDMSSVASDVLAAYLGDVCQDRVAPARAHWEAIAGQKLWRDQPNPAQPQLGAVQTSRPDCSHEGMEVGEVKGSGHMSSIAHVQHVHQPEECDEQDGRDVNVANLHSGESGLDCLAKDASFSHFDVTGAHAHQASFLVKANYCNGCCLKPSLSVDPVFETFASMLQHPLELFIQHLELMHVSGTTFSQRLCRMYAIVCQMCMTGSSP